MSRFCPHVHVLDKTTDFGVYFGSTIGGEYVAKPPLRPRLYNSKTQAFPNISTNQLTLFSQIKEPLAWQDVKRSEVYCVALYCIVNTVV